jgi:N-acetyl-D-muramate 6-phosphate phosphatase
MTIEISRIRALCFDVDGTLSDTDDLWVRRCEESLKPLSFLFPRRDIHTIARSIVMGIESPGNFMYHMLDRFGLDDELASIFNLLSRRSRQNPHKFWIMPHVEETLAVLQKSYPLSIVSARDEKTTLAFLDNFQIRPLFSGIATAQTCIYTKPYPHPVQWVAQKMGVSPSECLMVGDTVVDIRAGRSAGAQTVGVLCGFGTEKELRRAGADLIIPSTADLAGYLLNAS